MKKLLSVVLVVILLTSMIPSDAFAEHRHRGGGGRDWGWGLGGLVAGTMLGAAIASQPRYETVYVSGTPYYVNGGNYYLRDVYGNYYVVQPPVVVQQPVIVQQQPIIQQQPVIQQQPAQQPVVQAPIEEPIDKTVKVRDIVFVALLVIIALLMIGMFMMISRKKV